MKILHSAVASALLATTFISTPAFATVAPVANTTGLSPQEVCDEQLRPNNPNSDFSTVPENVFSHDWVIVETVIEDPVGDAYGVGTPTYSNVYLTSGFYRNGGSPNVWGGASATQTYPQTGQMYETTVREERTVSFDCHVHKDTPGTHVEPEGLQSIGNTTVESREGPGANQEVVSEDDFVNEGETVYALICISPNNVTKGKPGTWTGKHGFDAAACPAASIAAGGTVPSGNAPTI